MQLRGELEESGGTLHWVDVSEHMLALANERLEESDDFVQLHQQDALSFLREQKTCSLDVVKMTYAFGHLENLDEFFVSLAHALTQDGVFVSTISANNRLKSHSSNAAFFVNGDRVPESGYELTDGESYTIKFFTETGNPEASFLEGAETTKRYFSKEAIVAAAEAQGFTASFEMHERSEFDEKGGEEKQMTQEFLIVSKV
jgi:SAM-dependent methyltransferase